MVILFLVGVFRMYLMRPPIAILAIPGPMLLLLMLILPSVTLPLSLVFLMLD